MRTSINSFRSVKQLLPHRPLDTFTATSTSTFANSTRISPYRPLSYRHGRLRQIQSAKLGQKGTVKVQLTRRQWFSDAKKPDLTTESALPPQQETKSRLPSKEVSPGTEVEKQTARTKEDELVPANASPEPLPVRAETKQTVPQSEEDDQTTKKPSPSPPITHADRKVPTAQGNHGIVSSVEPDRERVPSQTAQKPVLPSAATAAATSAPPAAQVSDVDAPLPSTLSANSLSQRLSPAMDRLLASLADASQRLNTYTGTDYTPISTIRTSIVAQEQHLRELLASIGAAKAAYDTAQAQQASSQKEVVRLLERKNSWSAEDLERYMALIRSEHANDRAVSDAKERLDRAEWALEEGRAKLDRLERRQYHEEQVWSDTIRRNSTWVTMLLMGVNILLLLANLVVFEPWRRRRIVREIRSTLDEKAAAAGVGVGALADPAAALAQDAAAAPAEALADAESAGTAHAAADAAADAIASSGASTPTQTPQPPAGEKAAPAREDVGLPSFPFLAPLWADTWSGTWHLYRTYWHDMFSEARVSLRRVDVTTMVFEALAAGAACMGLVFVLLRPR